ncbi:MULTISPECIES: phenylacetate--CoA ligase family protein [unclassified Lentimicrobium]|uniref:phenylacetate--CoA ligase family protein n=1 Tax=unclassified Lentimicrobium TaxID=2677434 RepID=UPI0015574180|nr:MULTISPECIES: phenylacetate--CoA ligase family protein [unclassified Lentimicrobium]NPD44719.1 phenylacetate--CoA ligase family protein [Lentimicrobium sp. S6]NPD83425.1 phenylacetate--CoA ligase family protein [Lentimicrobium sp. L6]
MKTYPLKTIIAQAKMLSPFYRDLYKNLKDDGFWTLKDLPLTKQKPFWQANQIKDNQLLTGKLHDGIVFKSGGTTGAPKFSAYTKMEWETMTTSFGQYFGSNGLKTGDRVANLFYVGELYSSFIFLSDTIERCPVEVTIFPISGAAPAEFIINTMKDFDINVILCVPTTIMALADHIKANHIEGIKLDTIYFGGETMYEDQRFYLKEVFPGVEIRSVGYASVDAGLLGFADDSCAFNEHRQFDDYNIIEIIDEDTGQPIDEVGKHGKVYSTNLSRLLMPIIRYPVGDNGFWVEEKGSVNRKYKILGRSEEGARIGPVTFYVEDFQHILSQFESEFSVSNSQMLIEHFDHKDCLTLKIAVHEKPNDIHLMNEAIIQMVYKERHMFEEEIAKRKIQPIKIEWLDSDQLEINKRTGKLIQIIDKRFK